MRMRLLAAAFAALSATHALGADWRAEVPQIRWGMSASESEEERRARYSPVTEHLSAALGVPVDVKVTADVAGVVEALLSGQIEMFYFGASGYATAHEVTEGNLAPMVSLLDAQGNWGYRGVIIVRSDSDIQSFEDLKGRSFAYSDPGSTSGYLVPSFAFHEMGVDPESYFSKTGFSGGNNNSVFAVIDGTYDAAASWETAPDRSVTTRMVNSGLIPEGATRVIWRSNIIPDVVIGMRADLPPEMIEAVRAALIALPAENREAFDAMTDGTSAGLREVAHEDYAEIIEMRRLGQQLRRGQ
ncbi:MAG: phosphate/phosphite/phosphonate ABC transporter substrate-binding protein [Rubrimonas sp.]|uniref:phosphate/phosphite/phosphonate ABC transporter substrate-binding protein n=1 Tax=Rubrimonas sp. TaxID=2036015 RepID=UPI002FDCC870